MSGGKRGKKKAAATVTKLESNAAPEVTREPVQVTETAAVQLCAHCGHPVNGPECRAAAEAAAEKEKEKGTLVHVWDGPIEPMDMNAAMLSLIRQDENKHERTDTEIGRRCGCTRQHAHNLMHAELALTVPLVACWCNSRHLNLAYLCDKAAACWRQREEQRKAE